MVAQCALFNFVCSAIVLGISLVFIADVVVRDISALTRKTRAWTSFMLALMTMQFALEGDPTRTLAVTILYLLFASASLVTALYFCEIFYDVFFCLEEHPSTNTLLRVVKTYPVLRVLLVVTAALESVAIVAHTVNLTQFVNLAVAMFFHAVSFVPTCAVLIRVSYLMRRHRMEMEESGPIVAQVSFKVIYHL